EDGFGASGAAPLHARVYCSDMPAARACLAFALLACSSPPPAPDPDGGVMPDAFTPPPEDGGDLSVIHVRFDPSSMGFYRMPWPSDSRLTPEGTPDLSDFPNHGLPLAKTINEIETHVHGFATMPVAYFGLDRAVDASSLPQGTAALDPTSPLQL